METITLTGDPFVDAGNLALKKVPGVTIEEKIRFATDIYVDRWKGKLDSIFLHSKLNNNQVKGKPERQRQGALEYYLGALKGIGAISDGYCRICSEKGSLFSGGRNNYPLSGSGEFVNFHHFHESGLLICKNCLIKLYFLPLALLQASNLILLQVLNPEIAELWESEVILKNLDKISHNSSDQILKSKYTNPQNSLFSIASSLINRLSSDNEKPYMLRIFNFTNFASKPDVKIYDMPNSIFNFLRQVLRPNLRSSWHRFIKFHYVFNKSYLFDNKLKEWVEIKKGRKDRLDEETYSCTKKNRIFEALLSGKSILRYLCWMHKSEKFDILISVIYLKEVRKMKQEQIDIIRLVADKIIGLSEMQGSHKKILNLIEGASYNYQLRSAILRMVKANFTAGNREPFISFKDYVEYLFPDGQDWREVRDFLLICLYEKLHDLNIAPAEFSVQSENEIVETENETVDDFNV